MLAALKSIAHSEPLETEMTMHSAAIVLGTLVLAWALDLVAGTPAQAQAPKCVKGATIEMTGEVLSRKDGHEPNVTLLALSLSAGTTPCKLWGVTAPTTIVPRECDFKRRITATGKVYSGIVETFQFLHASKVRCQ